jgi:3-methyladenine DNA glycosylase AlkD
MKQPIVSVLSAELRRRGNPRDVEGAKRFFKEPILTHGVRMAEVSRLARESYREIKACSKAEVFALCEELLATGYMEEAIIACRWSLRKRREFLPSDLRTFERWIGCYVTNWAVCDTFCNHTVGSLIEDHPELVTRLRTWAKSKNRWLRRAAAVSLIVPAKRGLFLDEAFALADQLLLDREDLVQKGYGWLLKVASQKHEREVLAFVVVRRDRMPRTALRYAIELMTEPHRRQAMKK